MAWHGTDPEVLMGLMGQRGHQVARFHRRMGGGASAAALSFVQRPTRGRNLARRGCHTLHHRARVPYGPVDLVCAGQHTMHCTLLHVLRCCAASRLPGLPNWLYETTAHGRVSSKTATVRALCRGYVRHDPAGPGRKDHSICNPNTIRAPTTIPL